MKELYIRSITGALFAVFVLGAMFWSFWAFFGVIGVFTAVGLSEFIRLFTSGNNKGSIIYYFVGIVIYGLTALTLTYKIDISTLLLIIPGMFLLLAAELYKKPNPDWQNIGGYFTGIFYVAVPFGMMNAFFFIKSGSTAVPWELLALFILVWTNDVFAYLTGSLIGKHKLFESLSPKKTWEGTLGGVTFTVLFSWLFSLFTDSLTIWQWLIMGLIISVAANFGDLGESLLKRNAGVKDSGKIFPGHGGVLDRFDAMIFATPFVYYYLFLI